MDNLIQAKLGRVGTPLYLSPEVVKQLPYDYKVDTWAIGCCLYSLACLEPPFVSENLSQLGSKILTERPKNIPKHYSEKLNTFIIDTLLVKDPNYRPYVNQILKKVTKYFRDDIIKRYRD